ncbi:MAG: pitrilysin family protein [Dehalococcoidia bacterium]
MTQPWQISTLKNGLRVVTTPVPTSYGASVNVFVGAGSRGEDPRINGVSHFLEHILFKGTESWPNPNDIAETVEGAGGVLNAYTTKELTCYWNQVPYDKFDTAINVLADMMFKPILEGAEIERERTVVQQEIKRSKDQPSSWAHELLSTAVYGDQPIGWSIAGSEDSVAGLSKDDFTGYMGEWYVPSNMVLSVAGRVTHDQVVKATEEIFDAARDGQAPSFSPARKGMPKDRFVVETRDLAQAHIAMGLHTISRHDPDRYPLELLNTVLGRGMSSRLFKEVREKRGLAYAVGSGVSLHHDVGLLGISAGVSPENAKETVQCIVEELEKLVDEPVGAGELAKGKEFRVGNFRLSLESPMSLAQRAGESLLTMGEIEPVEEVVAKLEAVNAQDIQRVAADIIRRDNIAISVVGPGIEQAEIAELIAA